MKSAYIIIVALLRLIYELYLQILKGTFELQKFKRKKVFDNFDNYNNPL